MKRVLCVLSLALLISACGSDSATAPTPPPPAALAGTWSGTFQYTTATNTTGSVLAVAFNLTQADATINGTYATSAFGGTITGTATASTFSGTMTWNATTVSGNPCTGTMAVSGNAGLSTMTWTSPAITANCTNTPLGITVAIQRR